MKIITLILVFFGLYTVFGQELNCQVTVTSDPALDITTTEKEILQEIERTIFEFMNTTAWTKDEFEVEERINCNVQLSITKVNSINSYEGNLQVQVTRPVFNTTYNTVLFNFLDDKLAFKFERNAILVFAENEFRNNLTSALAFYAYFMIALDFDSFSKEGGTKYFNKAQQIVVLAQNGGGPGWRSDERGPRAQFNRYWLIENALQELFSPLRECFYEYHRLGLDNMYENPEKAKQAMFDALNKLSDVHSARPGSANVSNFIQSKLKELQGVFKDAETNQKKELVNLLKRLDPANASKYQEIL
jgi:hypothetical protein